jgi:hypothetical protein
LIPIPLSSVTAAGVPVTVVTSGTVPATAVYRGGFAFSTTGSLYVVLT